MPFDTPVLTCENEKEMSEQITNFVVTSYNEAVEERGRFAIALTGGRALTLLARRITEEPFISYIDWTKWYLFFVDERCASLDNPCSSYYMVDQVRSCARSSPQRKRLRPRTHGPPAARVHASAGICLARMRFCPRARLHPRALQTCVLRRLMTHTGF